VPVVSSLMRGKRVGNAMYSERNGNWINNLGNAGFKDVILLVRIARILNFLFLRNAKLEIEIWQ